ncbi:MAG: GEVED domain-containing protein, partial [Flavobacteriales bacterium]|nr:GEVED domain-containing protein [Flavobacteriales bacterium]
MGLLLLFFQSASAQTYFSESFESAFTGNPAAPPGWTQTRVRLLGIVTPAATLVDGPKDWARNTWSGTAWSVAAYTPATDPGAPPHGTAALWMEDSYFGSTTSFLGSRRVESPTINLASSTSPYIRFLYAYGDVVSTSLNFRVLVSSDGGTTWDLLSAVPGPGVPGWFKMNLWIPPAYRTANFKVAFEMQNTWGTSNLFVDHVRVEEFTPTTITSAASGNWNTATTWAGGVVPDADNHVVIAAGHTVSSNGNIDRCQDLTVNGTFQYLTTTATQLIQILGNLTVNSGGTYNSHSGTTGKRTYLNGSLTINSGGTLNFSVSGAHLILFGAHPATFTNSGTLTAGHIRNCWFVNTGGFTFNSACTISQTLSLVEGNVNPNGFLTVGNSTVSTTQTLERAHGAFTTAPTYAASVTRSQSYLSGGSVNFIPIRFVNLVPGEEVPLFSGVRTVQGTLAMNTWGNVELNYPLTVGTATSGGLTLTRGIIKTTAANLLTLSPFITGPAGTAPSPATTPTTHGSYVAGPLRIQFPTSGTTSRNFAVGVGSDFIGLTPSANRLRTVTIGTTTAWSGQDITVSLLGPPSGAVNAPLTTTMGLNVIRIQRNGASPDLPATATVAFAGNNYVPAYSASSDNMIGTQGQLAIAQATTPTGVWTQRSALTGTGAFVDNTNYSRTATAVAPLATNGEYFCLATTMPAVDDWSVVQLYTLGKTALGFGDNHVVKAYIRNLGTSPATKTVSLNVTGANSFSNTQSVTLSPGQWSVVSFAPYTNTALGTNTVTVSVPADAVTSNDSRNYTQIVTSNLMGYKEPTLPNDGGVGYTGISGDFVAKFTTATAATINELKVDFHSSGTPQPYKLGIWDDDGPGGSPGTLLHETGTLTSTPGSTAFISIPSISVSGGFFVGVRQTGTTNVAFGYQAENPVRQDGFYFAPGSGSGTWGDFANPPSPFRFSIENQFFVPTPPSCAISPLPVDGATGICSGTTLSWASGGGGPTGYRIYFGTSPTPPLVDSTTGTTWTLPTLTPSTTYYWRIVPYNAYGYATGCSVLSFTSHPSPTPCICNSYCTASQTTGTCALGDEYISSVTFNTLSNTSTCAASLPSGYTNYTSGPTTTVFRGSAYTLTVVNPNPFTGDEARAFFDWNQDGTFSASETVTLTTSDYSTFTASVTIPMSATLGTTRMRVRVFYLTPTPACGAVSWGEAEDYCITVSDPPPCSGTPAPGATTSSLSTACTGNTLTLNLTGSLAFSGLSYNWQASTDGGGTWTSFSTSAPPVTYTFGTSTTMFRCQVTCSVSGLTGTSSPVTVTLGGPCLCAAYGASSANFNTWGDITSVNIGSFTNAAACTTMASGPGSIAGRYSNYTTIPGPTFVVGVSNSFTVQVTNCTSLTYYYHLNIYVDLNQDGDFVDSGEAVYVSPGIGTPVTFGTPVNLTGSFTIPVSATLGNTRMRIITQDFGSFGGINTITPTGTYSWGETEDYCVTIAPPTCTWTGAAGPGPVWGHWTTPGNWDCGYVPTLTTNVIIPVTAISPAIVLADGNAYDINMHNGTQLLINNSNRRLNVANNFTFGTGTGAAINHSTGQVRMLASDGTGEITGNANIHTLDIAAGTGNVTITSGSIRVRNAVRLVSGTLNTMGNLTLESLLAPAHLAG